MTSRRRALRTVVGLLVLALVGVLGATAGAVPRPAATTSVARAEAQRISCAGFRNRVGITKRTLTIANVADVSGPEAGQYTSARQAVKAYVRYFNARHSICGRKLRVLALDSATSASAGEAAYARACTRAFAAVGSISTVDEGGAARAQGCRLPDLRAQTFSAARYACSTCFAAQVDQPGAFENAVPDFFLTRNHAATQAAAILHLDAGPWPTRATTMAKAETTRGMRFLYAAGIDVAEFDYAPYVAQLKSLGVRLVEFVGPPANALRLAQAMHAAGYVPDVFLLDPGAYTAQVAGFAAADGAYVPVNFTPFAEAASSTELRRYRHWLHEVAPGAAPTPAGLFAWSAARLFTRQALALGGRLSRRHLVAAVRGVHRWTGNGLHAAQDVGGKGNGNCWRFLRLGSGLWNPVGGTSYQCSGRTIT